MSKASQLIVIVAALILLVGAGGCGLKLVTQPGSSSTASDDAAVIPGDTVAQQVGGRGTAEEWIKANTPTYKFDGENLQFMQSVALRCGGDALAYEFTFDSRNGGYGNRINEALDGVKTSHTIRVTVQKDIVAVAVTDNRYNEMTGQFGELTTDTATEERCL
ncbi:hypothetical protein A2810_03190 [candidate division Kazan bacterium RIFCSPHIGHO2_01_FULL_49_10]|uniref:Uncharacterized protein n=1 Tax=candidate division Kazan bacterium RIFCSPLOWO2_01_FULL_48_13 TaxID=1798539 RepID=A0A1F4PPY4_UNCK3|nr:MAG: hypothetical protein A2810_03190 [candidate division Kazan bacterium RIFCSPHIGHO2_01_FULL_49_10]OGB85112.1 MAG: hypothetical protein A2994_03705 [candidate division Kazan bacterium RIFCSPLOWO2_01_FULL_48_13]